MPAPAITFWETDDPESILFVSRGHVVILQAHLLQNFELMCIPTVFGSLAPNMLYST